jgi:ABC-type sulfate transport system permease component
MNYKFIGGFIVIILLLVISSFLGGIITKSINQSQCTSDENVKKAHKYSMGLSLISALLASFLIGYIVYYSYSSYKSSHYMVSKGVAIPIK